MLEIVVVFSSGFSLAPYYDIPALYLHHCPLSDVAICQLFYTNICYDMIRYHVFVVVLRFIVRYLRCTVGNWNLSFREIQG